MQHRLHRLREDPRVRVESRAAVGRGMRRRGRPVPGSRRLDLRRRAPRLQGDRRGRPAGARARQDDRALHERAAARAVPRLVRAVEPADLRHPSRRDARDPRLRLRLPGPLGHRHRRDQDRARRRLPGHHQHDDLQGDRGRRRGRDDALPHRRGRHRRDDDRARLPVLPDRPGADDDARRARGEVPRDPRGDEGARLPLDRVADLPGLPHRPARAHLRAVGLDHAQPVRLEGPVLPADRRHLPDVRGAARGDGVGGVRPRQRPALRALRHPLRVRAVGGVRGLEQPEGDRAGVSRGR